jgi:hypothetical protein
MTSKLTLTVNKETIERAKRVARERGISISKMVEEFLNTEIEKDESKMSAVDQIHELLKGHITNPNLDWKKVKEERLAEKYGL